MNLDCEEGNIVKGSVVLAFNGTVSSVVSMGYSRDYS